MDNTRTLDIPGATRKVEVEGVLGILYKIRVGGEVVKRSKGAWAIPLRGGKTARLTSNGILPGFQTLRVDGTPIFQMGAHVPPAAKVAMFAPAVLILGGFLGAVAAVLLFLMNVMVVKNPAFPPALRVALPLINAGVFLAVLAALGQGIF